jgi:hypothetical protein
MFVIQKMFIEDKNLPKVLYALSGLVLNMEAPQPVVNAVVKKGKVEQASSNASLKSRVLETIATMKKGTEMTSAELKGLITKRRGNETSYNHCYMVKKAKMIKTKSRGVFALTVNDNVSAGASLI